MALALRAPLCGVQFGFPAELWRQMERERFHWLCRPGEEVAVITGQQLNWLSIPKALATAATLAWVAVSKYVDALPLYRLENPFVRMGIDLPRATLLVKSGLLVQPLINLLRDRLFEYGVWQMDETPVQVLEEPDKPATSTSYMWVQRGGPTCRGGNPVQL
ncbi:MAG: transposase [Magnetococcales bacterium]|nr:transposase [Magnetococcales bacterium]